MSDLESISPDDIERMIIAETDANRRLELTILFKMVRMLNDHAVLHRETQETLGRHRDLVVQGRLVTKVIPAISVILQLIVGGLWADAHLEARTVRSEIEVIKIELTRQRGVDEMISQELRMRDQREAKK